jgi:hypothetical protein
MKKTDNIYIDALKFGLTKMQTGLSFNELVNHLKSCMGYVFEPKYLEYFRIWFHQSFYNPDITIGLKYGTEAGIRNLTGQLPNLDEHKLIMTAESYEILLDYEKLQQARESSIKAHNMGITAIVISVLLGVIQIAIGYLQYQGH